MQLRLTVTIGILLAASAAAAAPQLVFEAAEPGFVARGTAWSAALSGEGATFALAPPTATRDEEAPSPPPVFLRVRIADANPQAPLRGEQPLASTSTIRIGRDATKWRSGVPHFGKVRASGVRPGVDVVWYGNPGRLETDYEVAPGADPAALALEVEGADSLQLDAAGDLVVRAGGIELRESRPVAYQLDGDTRRPVEARFELAAGHRVRFAVGGYDRTRPLVIDPVLSYATPLGGTLFEVGRRIVADPLGNTYVTGRTLSLDWPTKAPLQASFGGGAYDAFLAKLDAQGALIWSTYLGGTGEDWGYDVDLDAQGYLYWVGRTSSPNMPVVRAIQPALAGDTDSFLSKLTPDGASFVYLTYLGGTGHDRPRGVAADDRGRLVAAGFTSSHDHPLANPIQSSYGGGEFDAWVGIVSPFGDRLEFATYLGGSLSDVAVNVEVDAQGRPVVTGFTDSSDFPTVDPVQAVHAGISDAFVARIDPAVPALLFSTYLGGSGNGTEGDEVGVDVDLDAAGNIYVAGRTRSPDFPVVAPYQATLRGVDDAFVTKLAPSGSPILYSTYLGGSKSDEARALQVNAAGLAFVVGRTSSDDFPTASPVQPTRGGGVEDAFVSILAANGASVLESTFLGGSDVDDAFGVALDAQSNVFVTGETLSPDFPTVHAAQPAEAGNYDAFVAKILEAPEVAVRLTAPAAPGTGPLLSVQLANGSQVAKQVELKLWIEGPGLPVTSLYKTSSPRITVAAGTTTTLVANQALPAAVAFPGATLGARLLDGNTGEVLSESLCKAVPCH